MHKIYRDNNYLIVEYGGELYNFSIINTIYSRYTDGGVDRIEIVEGVVFGNSPKRFVIIVTDVVAGDWEDNLAVVYTLATLTAFFRENTAIIPTGGGGGGLTYVATDATLVGDGTPGFPLSVVPIISSYDERFDPFLAIVGNVWETLIVPNTPIHKIITVVIKTSTANVIVGAREVGSGLQRRIQIDGESATSFNVSTDMFGQIEIYSSNIGSTEFYVTSYLF